MTTKTSTLDTQARNLGPFFRATALTVPHEAIDPFLHVVNFRMSGPTFEPHPHAGFAAVTYMFPDSEGSFRNRDSLGDDSVIRPGDCHWTWAGAGMVHDEVNTVNGEVAHGLQIFVNLPAAHELDAPRGIRLARETMATRDFGGGRMILAFGAIGDLATPLPGVPAGAGDASLADLELRAGGELAILLDPARNAFVLGIAGETVVGDPGAGLPLRAGEALRLEGGGECRFGSAGGARLALFAGTPLREPVIFHGPFALSSRERLVEAIGRYQAGGMGRL